jgi:molybdopterin-binding protein
MRLSTRNQLPGTVTEIQTGEAMAVVKVSLDGGEHTITSSITREAVQDLGLAKGSKVTVLVKSTEVTLGID